MFIEHIIIPYIAGYYNFRTKGEWFQEHDDKNGKTLNNFRHKDEAFLNKSGFTLKIDKSEWQKPKKYTTPNRVKKNIRRRKDYKKYAKQKSRGK